MEEAFEFAVVKQMNKSIKIRIALLFAILLVGVIGSVLIKDPYFLNFMEVKYGIRFIPSIIEVGFIFLTILAGGLAAPGLFRQVERTTKTSTEKTAATITRNFSNKISLILRESGEEEDKIDKIKKFIEEAFDNRSEPDPSKTDNIPLWQQPLFDTKRRLSEENIRLGERGTSNLTWGVLFSIFTIGAAIVAIGLTPPIDKQPTNLVGLIGTYGPKITLVAISQIVAGFFLGMYVRNEKDLQRNKNELTNLDLRISACILATESGNKTNITEVIKSIIQEERNFIFTKKEKSIHPDSEAKILNGVKELLKELKS